MRVRLERVRAAWRPIFQTGVAAALAWLAATELLGHQRPFFAPVSAIITLGLSVHQRGRRAIELVLGVSLGIAVADLLIVQIGTGAAQLALVVLLATAIARFLGKGQLFASQAAVSAALVATLQPPTHGITFARSLDALAGGTIALLVNALILPADPRRLLREAARPVLDELAGVLGDIAAALRERDYEAAEAALRRARGIEALGHEFADAVDAGRETTIYAPPRRSSRAAVETYAGAAAQVDLAVRNVRVLARGAIRALRLDDNVPPGVADALERLARAVHGLGPALEHPEHLADVREEALRAAATATLVLDGTGNLSVSVIVGQIRSTAVDLLQGTGVPYEAAAEDVRRAAAEVDAASAASGWQAGHQ